MRKIGRVGFGILAVFSLGLAGCKPDGTAAASTSADGWHFDGAAADPMTGKTSAKATRTFEADSVEIKIVGWCGEGHIVLSVAASDQSGQPLALNFGTDTSAGIVDYAFRENVDGDEQNGGATHRLSEPENAVDLVDYTFGSTDGGEANARTALLAHAKSVRIEIALKDGRRPIIEINPQDADFQKLAGVCASQTAS